MAAARLSLMAAVLVVAACSRPPAELWIEPQVPLALDKKGKTVTLKVQTRDERHVFQEWVQPEWTSSDEEVAKVAHGGVVEAVGTGKAEVTATYQGLKASVPIKVRIIGSVEVTPPGPQKIKIYKTLQFTGVVKDDRGRPLPDEPIRWTRTTLEVDVDQTGKVSAEATGTTELIAKAKDKETRVRLEVTPP